MPVQLLPASAAAFAPRASSVNVVLGSKAEPWLTQILKRTNKVKRPLNNVTQHQRCLTETLSSPDAIWTLASLIFPKVPEVDMPSDVNEAMFNHQLVHVQAYIVHVDMVLRHEVAYKLTTETIDALVSYHKDVHCVDQKACTHDWTEKDQQCDKLHEDFVQAINKFVYHTDVTALEGLEEDGVGELLFGKSEEVKTQLSALLKPLLPPPPRAVEQLRQPLLLPSSPPASIWAQGSSSANLPLVDSWRILSSSPSVTSTSIDSSATPSWTNLGLDLSPSPDFTPPHTAAGLFYNSPPLTTPLTVSLPLPSMLAPQCSFGMGMGGFSWDRFPEFAPII